MTPIEDAIVDWALVRGIITNGTPEAQSRKTIEEAVELSSALKNNEPFENKVLELGDVLVTCVVIAHMLGITIDDAMHAAYNKIKHRKGYLNEHGIFIKDENPDLRHRNVA